jgi:hypothetical protein
VNRYLPAGAVSGKVSIDTNAVTNADYQKCVGDMHCEKNAYYSKAPKALAAPAAPAVGLNFEAAMRYCAWAGRRMPTVAELKAGLADAAFVRSDYSEWSNDWALSPGASCTQKDRNLCEPANAMGICSGVFPCNASLKLKQTIAPQTGEAAPQPHTTKDKIAFRCASDFSPSTAAPPWMLKNPPAPLADPAPLSASERALLHNLEATDTLNKPICKEKFTSPAHCKDPVTYFTPNESQNYQFAPYIRNLGGGYAGVAADANYSYIAAARSRYVWLFDFDVNINALHRIIRAMVLESPTVAEFLQKFEKKNNKLALEILEKYYKDRDDLDFIQQVYRNNLRVFQSTTRQAQRLTKSRANSAGYVLPKTTATFACSIRKTASLSCLATCSKTSRCARLASLHAHSACRFAFITQATPKNSGTIPITIQTTRRTFFRCRSTKPRSLFAQCMNIPGTRRTVRVSRASGTT